MVIALAVVVLLTTALYFLLQNPSTQRYLVQKIADKFSEQLNTRFHIGGINIVFFNRVTLDDFWMEDKNHDTLLYVKRLVADVDSFSAKRKFVAFKNISFDRSKLFVSVDSAGNYNYQFPESSPSSVNDSTGNWKFTCDGFDFTNSVVRAGAGVLNQPERLTLKDINLKVSKFWASNDSLSFNLRKLSLKSSDSLTIKNLSALIYSGKKSTSLDNINLETDRSSVSNASFKLIASDSAATVPAPPMNLSVEKSKVSMEELAIFIPAVRGMDEIVDFSGNIYGNLADLKGRDISIRTGANTRVKCNFYINGLNHISNAYLFLDLTGLQTSFTDLSSMKLPYSSDLRYLSFPEPFYQAGLISYKGNFTGFLTNFVAYGDLDSEMGKISTDLSFEPGKNGELNMDGNIVSIGFRMGSLFQNPNFGNLSFDGEIKAAYDQQRNNIKGSFTGEVSDIFFRNYNYRNISIDGTFENKNFDGFVNIDDPNLKLDFTGKLHLNPVIPEFNFDLSVRRADLVALKIDKTSRISDLAFISKANFKGSNIDNLNGYIDIENGSYRNSNGEITFPDTGIKTETTGNNRNLSFTSNFFNMDIDGQYNLRTLPLTFKYILSKYLPALKDADFENIANLNNNFKLNAQFKDLDGLTSVFKPGLTVETPFKIEGEINTSQNLLSLNGSIPGASTGNIAVKDISFQTSTNDSYTGKLKIGQFKTRSGLNLYNITLNAEALHNRLDTRLTWNNFHPLSYSGELTTHATISGSGGHLKAEIAVLPSKIYIADSLWYLDPGSISVDSSSVTVHNLNFHDRSQIVTVDGKISESPKDRISLSLENINLEQVETYLQADSTFDGQLNGKIEVEDFYGNRLLYSDLHLNGLSYNGQVLGNIVLSNVWDNENSVVKTDLEMTNNDQTQLSATGFYNPESRNLNFNVNVNHLPILLLSQILQGTFSDLSGNATGKLKIHGHPENVLMDGALMGENAGLTVDVTQVHYHFNDSVYFAGNKIIFNHINFRDDLNNIGIFNGSLTSKNFDNMSYDLSVSSPKILAMNTTMKDNSSFYGKVVAGGNFYITGRGAGVNLDGDGKTLLGTDVSISLDDEQEAQQYDFIQFMGKKTRQDTGIVFSSEVDTSTNLNLQIQVTPEAKAQLIYNSQIGDVIRGQGEGVLQFGMDNNGDITIYGNYNIVQGDYLFTLKNVINKKFTIESGGTIKWTGDPYNAKINIEAVYRLKASLYELLANSDYNVDKSQRIPVECKILLSDNLANPTIKFDIDFPMVETGLVDRLRQFFNTEEEMNKQIFSLVVLGQFSTPEYLRGSYEATTSSSYALGSTASELFSNQFSNWLSQISNNLDIGVNYRPGNQITRDEIEFALSKQMFNDRVTLNGNIGNNANPTSTNNSQIVGDFDVDVKLTNNGKIELKAFNRSNNNLIYETAPYTQGIGITFKEDYNTFQNLLRKLFAVFEKKKKKQGNSQQDE